MKKEKCKGLENDLFEWEGWKAGYNQRSLEKEHQEKPLSDEEIVRMFYNKNHKIIMGNEYSHHFYPFEDVLEIVKEARKQAAADTIQYTISHEELENLNRIQYEKIQVLENQLKQAREETAKILNEIENKIQQQEVIKYDK